MVNDCIRYLGHVEKAENDSFLLKEQFAYSLTVFDKEIEIIIEMEIHLFKICILSFYPVNFGDEFTRYQVRLNLSAGQTIRLLDACMSIYDKRFCGYALLFSGANDMGENVARNKRYVLYVKYLDYRYDFKKKQFDTKESIESNSFLMMPPTYNFRKEAEDFFNKFHQEVLAENNQRMIGQTI